MVPIPHFIRSHFRKLSISLCLFFTSLLFLSATENLTLDAIDAEHLRSSLKTAADWQLTHPMDEVGLRWWHMAPYYDGLIELSKTTGDTRYLEAVIARGERVGWSLGDRIYHADDHAVGHAWLAIYAMDPSRADRMDAVKTRMDEVIEHPVTKELRFGVDGYPEVTDRWSWCDALYMAPPTLARLYAQTGDGKYLRFMEQEYRFTYDQLWDKQANLFYRDARFIDQVTENGKKIFWSRGNGWVYGGLPMVLDALTADDVSRKFFETIYLQMSQAILAAQQPDGLWRPNLADPEQVPTAESSGSGFFLYGIAWGIRHGLLDRDRYEPVLVRGWLGLMGNLQDEGYLGYVQPVGFDPRDNIEANSSHVYGTGAMLLAGSEILRLKKGLACEETGTKSLFEQAQAAIETGGWIPATGGYVVPRRVDDLAWENEHVAFRVYGPDLRESTEDSGVDVWTKRVAQPIVFKWYQGSFDGSINYHEDTGEGFDGYKVGNKRGCGGTALWYRGQLHTANVYERCSVMETETDRVKLLLEYRYLIEGQPISELKTVELRSGDYLCRASSVFKGSSEILDEAIFAIGLTPQQEGAEVFKQGDSLVLWEPLGGYNLGTAVRLPGADAESAVTTAAADTEKTPGDVFLTRKLAKERSVSYAFGFAWSVHSPFETADAWLAYVSRDR